jgi:hypothetical protein
MIAGARLMPNSRQYCKAPKINDAGKDNNEPVS